MKGADPRPLAGGLDVLLGGHVHFMGVGGAGMTPLAELVLRSGGNVSGCDHTRRGGIGGLERLGLRFFEGHDPAHVADAAALVLTAAVPHDHPEVQAARARGIPVLKRAQALGAWVNRGTLVAVAGTHGKTTTTALTTHVLAGAGLDPTGIVGGEVASWGGNLRLGSTDLFVVEADEYDRSFHTLRPRVAVVTNLEADHLDVYKDLRGVVGSFETFVEGLVEGGTLWICGDDPGAAALVPLARGAARSYGLGAGSQLRGVDVTCSSAGSRFRVVESGGDPVPVTLLQPGIHNVRNALAAVGVARTLGAGWEEVAGALSTFTGVGRRYDVLGTAADVTVIDDYAHHPTEIHATLGAARAAYPGRRVVAVFQPHLYSRTRDFAEAFGKVLGEADRVWVTDVYPAREAPIPGITGALVHDAVPDVATRGHYHPEIDTLAEAVVETLEADDVCVVMGAGSIEGTGARILALLQERSHDGGW